MSIFAFFGDLFLDFMGQVGLGAAADECGILHLAVRALGYVEHGPPKLRQCISGFIQERAEIGPDLSVFAQQSAGQITVC